VLELGTLPATKGMLPFSGSSSAAPCESINAVIGTFEKSIRAEIVSRA